MKTAPLSYSTIQICLIETTRRNGCLNTSCVAVMYVVSLVSVLLLQGQSSEMPSSEGFA